MNNSVEQNTYSVLMSVYYKENAEYLDKSMESMFQQSVSPNDFVLVCDGPLGNSLENVIEEKKKRYGDLLQVVRLQENRGLGNALNEGLKYCRNELVARMDSDDISVPERCERQLGIFAQRPMLSVVSGTVLEFVKSIEEICGKRELPVNSEEIVLFSKKRNPFNHPAIMFRKSAVVASGGYSERYPLFEDYYLWVRMLQNGCLGYNIKEPIVWMRTTEDIYLRRGGKKYAQNMLRFHGWLRRVKWTNYLDYFTGAIPHAFICVLPNCIRKGIYKALHR